MIIYYKNYLNFYYQKVIENILKKVDQKFPYKKKHQFQIATKKI